MQHNSLSYSTLLQRLTIDSKDDGNKFTICNRVDEIKRLLQSSNYRLIHEGPLSLIYARQTDPAEWNTLISSHIDCVYQNCFMEEAGDCWIGTFDNSATNAVIIDLMLRDELNNDVVIAFTGDEEIHSGGAVEVMNVLHKDKVHLALGIILDVTEEGWEDEAAFSIENDRGFDILTGYHIIQLLQSSEQPCTLVHQAEPDETWDYGKGIEGIFPPLPCLSLCLPASGELHGEKGVLIRKASVEPYSRLLKEISSLTRESTE